MTMPKQLVEPSITNARLVTKTSLSNPKKAIALFLLLWYENGQPAMLTYGQEEATSKDGGIVDEAVVSQIRSYAGKHAIDISNIDIKGTLSDNPLLVSQIESLNAAFELIWHLGRFSFAVPGRSLGAERTGGTRYRKRIDFTCNVDLISLVADGRENELATVMLSWLTNGEIPADWAMEERLLKTLTAFSETSYYKTSKGNSGRVFAPSGVYDAILEGSDVVDLVDNGAEAQGPTRIFKAILKEQLNRNLVDHNGSAAINPNIAADELREYSDRAKTTVSLSRIEVDEKEFENTSIVRAHADGKLIKSRNLICFGAPGTGKSFCLASMAKEHFEEERVRRVTFHPDYTYAQFVGCYKPYSGINDDGEHEVYYKYTLGPFLETYVDALKHPENSYLLIIEEINRANPAAVFGDIFQLLDRKGDGTSDYAVIASQDMGEELFLQLSFTQHDDRQYEGFSESERQNSRVETVSLPANMYIWATMNSADQGVFPMDTAFKRRWDFEYIGINDAEASMPEYLVPVGSNGSISWNSLRRGINNLLREAKINEDKWLGPYFIKPEVLGDSEAFTRAFKDKVLLYLYEDAAKTRHNAIFADGNKTYSELCSDFDEIGTHIFKDFDDSAVVSEMNSTEEQGTGEYTSETDSENTAE